MHKLILIIFLFLVGGVFSQSIENVDFRAEGMTIVVTYDFLHSKADTAINVKLVFKDQKGGVVTPKTISGNLKNVKPGESKRIVWDVLSDGINLSGKYKAEVTIKKNTPVKNTPVKNTPVINLKFVLIGKQSWTSENLNVDRFRNGDLIPEAKTIQEWEAAGNAKSPAWCYYDNDPNNGAKYGKLYNWYAVNDTRGLAPTGWHVPTDAEWTILSDFLGGENQAGTKMKSTSGWSASGNGSNSSGFSGLPGGYREFNGYFSYVGYFGNWLSASEFNVSDAWDRRLYSFHADLYRSSSNNKNLGFSVRCVRD